MDVGVVNQLQSLPQGSGCPPCLDLGITWAKALKKPSDARAPPPDSDLIGPEDSNVQTRQRIIIPVPRGGVEQQDENVSVPGFPLFLGVHSPWAASCL